MTVEFRTIEELARLLGQCRWFESRLFEVLGGWVAVEGDAPTKLLLRAHSYRHAWHAEVWEGLLPTVAHLDFTEVTKPVHNGSAAFMEALAAADRPEQTVERLVGVYRVAIPRLAGAYHDHLERAALSSEGPVRRWLRLLSADEDHGRQEGEDVLERLLRTTAEVERAGTHQASLEMLLREVSIV